MNQSGPGTAPLRGASILSTLQATDMADSRPVLPAEILSAILDVLPVADQLRFARVSRRMREMVYDDTRWIARLKSIGCWDEIEARRHFDAALTKRRKEAAERANSATATDAPGQGLGLGRDRKQDPAQTESSLVPHPPSAGGQRLDSVTLFDAAAESVIQLGQDSQEILEAQPTPSTAPLQQNDSSTLDGRREGGSANWVADAEETSAACLYVLNRVRSVRGFARHEYGRVYGALAPFYFDLVRARIHTDPAVFKAFRDPERQAQVLANLGRFARSDWALGWADREAQLAGIVAVFERAAVREFEQAYEFWDVDGRMQRYARVLHQLNGGAAAVDIFVSKHPLLTDYRHRLPNPLDCINQAPQDGVVLDPSRLFLDDLLSRLRDQASIIARIFPRPAPVFWQLVDRVRLEIVMDYATSLFDEAHERSLASYLKAVSGLFEQVLRFLRSLETLVPSLQLTPPSSSSSTSAFAAVSTVPSTRASNGPPSGERVRQLALASFEPHLDLYLQEELDWFVREAETQVGSWEKRLSEQGASVEHLHTAGLASHQADKKDFLSSFKKVVMMPVNALPLLPSLPGLPGLPIGSPFGPSKPMQPPQPVPPHTPGVDRSRTPQPDKAPGAELAAKAVLLASRLEGIRSLFSIEVALSLVHAAKSSIDRASIFIVLGGQAGGEAREQCVAVFVAMLRILGSRHVKSGFDVAVGHLSRYEARADHDAHDSHHDRKDDENDDDHDAVVAPLATFIELVNVGDLIQQMVDVFFEQQLAARRIADRADFLDPAVKAKRKFEQMLDESVAAGLNKGIDALIDEVDYINATTQLPADYNPSVPLSPPLLSGPPSDPRRSFVQGMWTDGGTKPLTPTSSTFTTILTSSASIKRAKAKAETEAVAAAALAEVTVLDVGPTDTARRVVRLVTAHTRMLIGSTDKPMLDVFNAEVCARLFAAVCKHLKRQRISTAGAPRLLADMALYHDWARALRSPAGLQLPPYFAALRALSQLFLIDAHRHAREMAAVIADVDRFAGVFRAEEVYEFAQRRADWYQVRKHVERAMYGMECVVI